MSEPRIGRERAEPERPKAEQPEPELPEPEDPPSQDPNLTLLYSLIALALTVAIGLALMIVLPFYHRR